MFTLLREVGLRRSLTAEAPALLLAFACAELLYKFGSFALECVAFLATWCVFSAVAAGAARMWRLSRPVES